MNPISRRNFLKITGLALASGVVSGSAAISLTNEAFDPVVVRKQIPIKNLPFALDGFTIVQMTDFHLYPYTTSGLVRKAVELANSLQPNLTVLTGDYVWRILDAADDLAAILSGLDAQHGVFCSLGNHDIWLDVDVVLDAFKNAGLPMLVNQGVPITVGRSGLYLVGLDDGWSGNPDLSAALQPMPSGAPVVLLYHEPDLADEVSIDSRVSLMLSGHSHGGQVRVPGRGPFTLPYLGRKYDLGLYRIRDLWLYTNPGIGMISVPYRFNCPPEVTEFTLIGA